MAGRCRGLVLRWTVRARCYSREHDALGVDVWESPNGRAWLNPPFSRLGEFVSAALEQMDDGYIWAMGLLTLADVSTRYWRKLELLQHGSGVVTYRLPIEGRFSCDPPPGITYSTPTRPMAVWILRRKLAELGRGSPRFSSRRRLLRARLRPLG